MQSVKLGVVCVSLEGEKTDLARRFKRQAVKSLQDEYNRIRSSVFFAGDVLRLFKMYTYTLFCRFE